MADPLTAPLPGADHREVNGVQVDVVPAGNARLKRVIWPPGHRWSVDMKPLVGTELCMHAHVGFLARGRLEGRYADGCTFAYEAPAAVVIEPGHDGWVVGDEPVVLIQLDYEGETAQRFGLGEQHTHND
jgi:hypothetical protein